MSKQNIKDYRQQFIDQGYAIVENVLTPKEAKKGATILLDKIHPESPESYAHIWGTRRTVYIKLMNKLKVVCIMSHNN